jgi:predicted N-acyltransferase
MGYLGTFGKYEIKVAETISDLLQADWDDCIAPGTNPCSQYRYLQALELSGSTSIEKGYQPAHLCAYNEHGKLTAIAPAYIKVHSEAEIGADMGWSMAYERSFGPYYPKLQVEVPYCTLPCQRLITKEGAEYNDVKEGLISGLKTYCQKQRLSSVQFSHLNEEESAYLQEQGFLVGSSLQHKWTNKGYKDFDSFLREFVGKKKNEIKRERRKSREGDLSFHVMQGLQIPESALAAFYPFLQETHKKYNAPLITNLDFYLSLPSAMGDDLVLIMAKRGEKWVAGSLSYCRNNTLSVVNWGGDDPTPFLHFELTYYLPIEFAIANEIQFIEAGPGGGYQKALRGFTPTLVRSAHWFPEKKFMDLLSGGIQRKQKKIETEKLRLLNSSPFARDRQ